MNAMDRFRRDCAAFFDELGAGAQKPLVFGDGQADGPVLMLVGEAPGEQEALEGRPFVGKAGRNLAGFLEALGLRVPRIAALHGRLAAAGLPVGPVPLTVSEAISMAKGVLA